MYKLFHFPQIIQPSNLILSFKTFDKFCDESYDLETDLDKRIEKTLDSTIQLIDAGRHYPTEIDKICQHNQQLFFDRTRLERKLAKFGKLCLTQLYNVEIEQC